MSIPLPAVISSVSSLLAQPQQSPALINPDPLDVKKMVICVTRDISKSDMKLLQSFGQVKSYDSDIHNNIDPSTLAFDYLIVDLRELSDRLYFQKYFQNKLDYHTVLYKFSFESDMNVSFEAEFCEFPPVQATKQAFDGLLIQPPIKAPSVCLSFLGALGKCGQA
jgi:hypothetical protein